MKLRKTGVEPLDEYCEGVMSGDINVCKWVRLAVERHYSDLERAENDPEFPYYFEPKAHWHYVNFFSDMLCHYDGTHRGNPIEFEPWQHFVWGSPFGWLKDKRINDMPIRRFRERVIIIPKKQGKSILVGGTMLYMFYYDEWSGAQVYALARNRSHAEKLGYRDAEIMKAENPEMDEKFKTKGGAAHRGIYTQDEMNFIQPLTSKPESTDGLKVHYAGNDEIKDWDDFEIYDVITDGTAANHNSLIDNITTAGSDRSSLGWDRQQYLKEVLEGVKTDEQTFGVIYTISDEDRERFNEALAEDDPYPLVEDIIEKANPNYGVSVQEDYYRQRVNNAQNSERKKNAFLTKHLNVWINAMENYFNILSWINDCKAVDLAIPGDLKGRPCHLFGDLANKKDICSLYALFPHGKTQDGKKRYVTHGINFLPEAVVSENVTGHRAEYNAWAEAGHFLLTPGNVTDYGAIEDQILWFNKHFRLIRAGFDPWGASQLAQNIQKRRIDVVMIKQNTKNISEPMKTLDAWITYRRPSEDADGDRPDKGIADPRLLHGDDPVLRWAISNVVAKEDANENVYPRKDHRDKKIDPATALINLVAMEMEKPMPESGTRKRVPKVWSVNS